MTKDSKASFRLSYIAGEIDMISYILNTWRYELPRFLEDILELKKESLEKEFKYLVGDNKCNLIN